MTRVVVIGTLADYKYSEEGFAKGQGNIEVPGPNGTSKIRFTIFNNEKDGATNPHTKAKDFAEQFKPGDRIYLTGQDNRSYSEEKERAYEDVMVWDYRAAEEEEISRWVFVYVGDLKVLEDNEMFISYVNYKEKETIFPVLIGKTKLPAGLEAGDRIKVKGTVFSGLKMDFYGDGEYVTERTAVEVKVVNSKEEVEAENTPVEGGETGLWG